MRNPSRGADVAAMLHGMHLTRALRPTQNRKGRPVTRTALPESQKSNGTDEYSVGEAAAQRAVAFAQRRAASLDRTADLLLSIGRVPQAERLAHRAAAIREVLV